MATVNDCIASAGNTDRRDRERLLAHVLGKPREWILAHPESQVPMSRAARFCRLLARRERGEPLPYLLGEQWFYGRPFTVNRHVLIPRPETETMIELAIEKLGAGSWELGTIIDVGTGSGCIAVTLAAELPRGRIIATDSSPAALRVARANARRHGIADRITFLRGNLLSPRVISRAQPEKSHTVHRVRSLDFAPGACPERGRRSRSARDDATMVVLANLPYLTTAEWRALPRSIRDYEPREALDGGPDGMKYFRELFAQLGQMSGVPTSLKLRGAGRCQVFLEMDPRRKRALDAIVRTTLPGWEASWHRDLAGRWRILEVVRR